MASKFLFCHKISFAFHFNWFPIHLRLHPAPFIVARITPNSIITNKIKLLFSTTRRIQFCMKFYHNLWFSYLTIFPHDFSHEKNWIKVNTILTIIAPDTWVHLMKVSESDLFLPRFLARNDNFIYNSLCVLIH